MFYQRAFLALIFLGPFVLHSFSQTLQAQELPIQAITTWKHGVGKEVSWYSAKTLKDLNNTTENWIAQSAGVWASQPNKEYWSLRHQQDLLRFADAPAMQQAAHVGLYDREIYRMGVMDSDKGKLAHYAELLITQETEGPVAYKSDLLIRTMQLKSVTIDGVSNDPALAALENLLTAYLGRPEPVFNPDMTPAQVRSVISNNRVLLSWMHEWPGAADAIEMASRGVFDADILEKVLKVSLFHNGPDKGFWGFFTHSLLGKTLDSEGKRLFEGSFLNAGRDQFNPVYEMPRSIEGILHVAIDRLSQATRGGFVKIWYELKDAPNQTPETFVSSVIVSGTTGTLEQLSALKEHTQQGNFLTPEQRKFALKVIDLASERIVLVQNFDRSSLSTSDSREDLASFAAALLAWAKCEDQRHGEAIEYVASRLPK